MILIIKNIFDTTNRLFLKKYFFSIRNTPINNINKMERIICEFLIENQYAIQLVIIKYNMNIILSSRVTIIKNNII